MPKALITLMRSNVLILSVLLWPDVGHALPAEGEHGMVVTAHALATEAGVQMLRQGGTAADAACAAAFALAVVEQNSSGLGGGGFALTKFSKDVQFLDFREVAPQKAYRDMYVRNGQPSNSLSRDGILSVGVPGAVAGYLHLHTLYGKLSRAQVLGPALKLARTGFLISNHFRKVLTLRLALLRKDPEAARILLIPGPKGSTPIVPPLGYRLVQADLANTIEAIIQHGAEGFYQGHIAKLLAADMKERGGLVSTKDLARYKVRLRDPLMTEYRGRLVVSSPPPSSGGQILLTILNIMETLPEDTPWRSVKWLHTYIEASKRAYADRILLGDPAFVPYVQRLMPKLIAQDRADIIAEIIGDRATATPAVAVPYGQGASLPLDMPRPTATIKKESAHTTHLSVIDRWGNAVSMTSTLNYRFGSGVIAKGTGMIWNDEMDDFAVAIGVKNAYEIVGSEANAVAPGKVPLSSMTPTLVFEGPDLNAPLRLIVGSPGGSRIPSTVAQIIMHYLDYNAPIDKAIAIGRVHHQHLPDIVRYERFSLEPASIAMLRGLGHKMEEQGKWSNANAIAIDPKTGVRTAAADPRGLGSAIAE